ncbi:hypothetical protein EG68_08269 [Paragonimus skrjabini miyazakii]|uniref:Uncharacterized protein n=1 Tax=Paragonimus skrjabini miyazakii TaxID=59628 RepID=A0A8S9Z2Y7_9TREM|nr:hypothetical protein EG68_08269 [Paragonimus skrjabini miyazakii]
MRTYCNATTYLAVPLLAAIKFLRLSSRWPVDWISMAWTQTNRCLLRMWTYLAAPPKYIFKQPPLHS